MKGCSTTGGTVIPNPLIPFGHVRPKDWYHQQHRKRHRIETVFAAEPDSLIV